MKKKMGLISHSLKMRKARGSRRPHSTQLGVGHELLLLYTVLPVCDTEPHPMKKNILLPVVFLALSVGINAQTNYYSLVTNLWYLGAHTSVVELAQHRLAANTNDIAGLITMAGYDLVYSCNDAYSNVVPHVLSSASNVTSTAFHGGLSFLTFSLTESLDFLTTYHPTQEEQLDDLRKAALPGKFFIYEEPLRLLDEDGYFANDPPMPEGNSGDE